MKPAYAPHKVQSLRPLKDTVLVTDMVFKERKLNSGLILLNDNGTTAGIRPRWGRIYAVGPEQKDYSVGEGNAVTIRKVDPKDILLISDEQPSDDTMSDAVQVTAQKR